MFLWHQENTLSKAQKDVSLLQKILVSRNKQREIENHIGARDVNVLIANFLLQVCEFLFFICVKKTISMKILVLRAINSLRHRNCFVRGYIHLFVSKALIHLLRFSLKQLVNTTRTLHFLWRKLYIFNCSFFVKFMHFVNSVDIFSLSL